MRAFLFALIFSTCNCVISQPTYLVGKVAKNSSYVFLFKGYDSLNCGLDYKDALRNISEQFLILGDTTCDGINRCYITVSDGTIKFVERYNFSNKLYIDSSIQEMKKKGISISDILKGAKEVEVAYKKQVLEEAKAKEKKEREESIESDRQYTKSLDSLLTLYRKLDIILDNWDWSYESEHYSAFDFSFTIINPYKKKIKYVWVTFKVYNAVDDPAIDRFSRSSVKTVQGIGPIEYGSQSSYNFESAFYSNVASKVKITTIKIQFFDGTFKTINNPLDIESILERSKK